MNAASSPLTVSDSDQSRVAAIRNLESRGGESIPALLDMLADSSWVVRRAVVEALATIGEVALAPLTEGLHSRRDSEARIAATVDALVASRGAAEKSVTPLADHADPAIVADVAQILGRRRSQFSIPLLVKLTKHASDNVAVGAIEALGRIGGRAAIEALVATTQTGNFFRTFPAIDVLGRSGDPRVVEPLTRLLDNANYLPEATRALGRSGERAALKPLVDLLESKSDAVVRVAALSIAELRLRFEEKAGVDGMVIEELFRAQAGPEVLRRLMRTLSGADAPEAIAICDLLGVIGSSEAAPILTARLDGTALVAERAAEALKRIGRDADTFLLIAIREGKSARRKVLLPVVTRTGAALELLVCLGDADSEVRALACDTLGRLGNQTVVPEIFKLLGDPNLRVVHSAIAAIQSLGSREARSLAIEASRSGNPGVRRSALNILAYFGDVSATQPMLNGLEDPDARVREAAIQGLPYLEDLRALEALFEASRHSVARTRSLAMRALGQVPKATQRAYSVLLKGLVDSDAWVRYYACQSLGRLAYAPASPEIAKLLGDEAGQVRVSAVEALSHLNSPEAHAALKDAAHSPDLDVKRAALVGLGISHRAEDLPIILSAAASPDAPTRLLALSALVNFSSPLVFGALSAAGADLDEQVRSAAIGFLAIRPEQEATEVLVELLSSELTRERARAALGIPSAGRTAGLLVALETANDEMAPVLVSILSRIDRAKSKGALLAAMKLGNAAARKAAATGLASHLDPEMTAALKDAADNDPNREVRHICTLLLSE